jgi:hypothetical protein
MQQSLWICCKRDILYWVNSFVFIEEPRAARVLPFITYPYQDVGFLEMVKAVGNYPLLMKKSRDMGVSWMLVCLFSWFWLFHKYSTFLLGSRKEEYVDSPDTKSLFGKIRFLLDHLPPWMIPKHRTTFKHLINTERHNNIDGEASNPDWGRGDRRTAMGMDEFAYWPDDWATLAATDDASKCRIWVSTPNGTQTAFYSLSKNPAVRQLILKWTLHPEKTRGLYATENGALKIIDRGYNFPPDYPFILDGKLRSPWYDEMCRERQNDRVRIGQELDLSDFGSVQQFFDDEMLTKYAAEHVEPPLHIGEIDYDPETLEPSGWSSSSGGRWSLYTHFDASQKMPDDRRYVVAADIAAGTGASNSAIIVGDCQTRRIVATFVSPFVTPEALGRMAVVACKWFAGSEKADGGARLTWETNGYGAIFGKTVVDVIRYRNLDYRQKESAITKKPTDVPGWHSSPENKTALLGELRRSVGTQPPEIIIPAHIIIEEMREFVHGTNGVPEHTGSLNAKDASGAGDAHGDTVIPAALVCRLLRMAPKGETAQTPKVHPDSFKARQEAAQKKRRMDKYWS